MPTPKLPDAKRQRILDLHKQGMNGDAIAKKARVSVGSVSNVIREAGLKSHKLAKAERNRAAVLKEVQAGGPWLDIGNRAGVSFSRARQIAKTNKQNPSTILEDFPEPIPLAFDAYNIDRPGQWGIISDIHIPAHDPETIKLFVAECKRRAVVGIVLNGDVLDSHEVSDHLRDPSAIRYCDEIDQGKKFLAWLRKRLPNAEIVYKEGNHEDRVSRYLLNRAPAIEGLEGVNLQSWLHLGDFGIEWIGDKRIIHLGKLNLIHGHEYKGGGGVNPARWLYLRAGSVAMCGHFHRVSEHHERNIDMRYKAAWSLGCACYLHPRYAPINNWQHGFAFVHLEKDGNFAVENKRVLGGKIV